jgi:hypothetical protein
MRVNITKEMNARRDISFFLSKKLMVMVLRDAILEIVLIQNATA